MDAMTVGELRSILNKMYEHSSKNDDLIIGILTNDPSIGSRSYVTVNHVSKGFDWESGKLMVSTSQPVKKVTV